MAPPDALARYLQDLLKAPAVNPEKFFSGLLAKYPKSAALLKQQKSKGKEILDSIASDLSKVHAGMTTSGPNRGNRDLNRGARPAGSVGSAPNESAGNAKGKGKGKGKKAGAPQPYLMECVGSDDMFWMNDADDNRVSAKRFAVADLSHDATGFCVASGNALRLQLHRFFHEDIIARPCAILCKKAGFDAVHSTISADVVERYPTTTCTPYWADADGCAIPIECVMFQLGSTAVEFNNTTVCQVVDGELADSYPVSVQIPNLNEATDFDTNVKPNFQKTATTILGKLLYQDVMPYHSTTISMQHKKSTIAVHRGIAKVNTAQLNEVWRRSGHRGVFIRSLGSKEPFQALHLPVTDTLENAMAKAHGLKQLAYGVIPTHNGFAIRVKPEEYVEVLKQLKPDYAAVVGDELLHLAKGEGHRLYVYGVPRAMSDIQLMEQLSTGTWILGLGPRCATPGKKIVLVTSKVLPLQYTKMLQIGPEKHFVQIKEEVRSKQQESMAWDKIGKDTFRVTAVAPRAATAPSTVWAGQTWQESQPNRQPATQPPTSTSTLPQGPMEDCRARPHPACSGGTYPGGRPNFDISTPNRMFRGAWADQ